MNLTVPLSKYDFVSNVDYYTYLVFFYLHLLAVDHGLFGVFLSVLTTSFAACTVAGVTSPKSYPTSDREFTEGRRIGSQIR